MTGAEIEQRKQRSESGRNPTKSSSRRLGVEVRARGRIAGEIASEQRCKTQNEDGCQKHYLAGYSNIETGGRRSQIANFVMCHVTEHVFSPRCSIISALIPSLITIYSTEFCKNDHQVS